MSRLNTFTFTPNASKTPVGSCQAAVDTETLACLSHAPTGEDANGQIAQYRNDASVAGALWRAFDRLFLH